MSTPKNNIVDLSKLSLFKDNKAGRVSSLNWSIRNGYPRITTFINGEDRSVTGMDNLISCPFTYLALNSLIGAMKALLTDPNDTEYEIKSYNTLYVDGHRTDDTYLQGTTFIGKDAKGIFYIATAAENKPLVKFILNTPKVYYKIYKNGVDISDSAEGSLNFMKRYIKQLEFNFDSMLVTENKVHTPQPYSV